MVVGGCEMVVIREYDAKKDCKAVLQVENMCEIGPNEKFSLYTDLLGDPICRIRNSPAYLMLVAEMVVISGGGEERREIVGMIRGCVKNVTCGTKRVSSYDTLNGSSKVILSPIYTTVGYVLGLRVSPAHRRKGIAVKLVEEIEQWFHLHSAEYSYMATSPDNAPSLNLFTDKCHYRIFRTPTILVRPVFAHRVKVTRGLVILRLNPSDAALIYHRRLSTSAEFFPQDIQSILQNPLSLGTFLAYPSSSGRRRGPWLGAERFLSDPPESWAVASVWNCKDVFSVRVRGASRVKKSVARATRVVDGALPFLKLPSVPDLFRPFGFHFLYGLFGEGPEAVKCAKGLCGVAHNMARECGCGVVATEVGSCDPLRLAIPHWKRLSCAEDLWCVKTLNGVGDWTGSKPSPSIFVDPREI